MSDFLDLVSALPKCSIGCLLAAFDNVGCAITNQTCACHDEDLTAQATTCIQDSCTVREALSTKNLTDTYCGVTPNTAPFYPYPVFLTFTALCAVSVLLRVIARLKVGYPFWWDDIIIALSFLGCVAFTTIGLMVLDLGLGMDIWAIPFDDITTIFKGIYVIFVIYITSRHLVRGSILLFCYRLLGHDPLPRRLIQVTLALLVAFCVALDLAMLFGCTPIDHFWKSWDDQHEGHCISLHAVFWAGAAIDISIDLWILLLPIPFIMRLKLSLQKKILSGIMFGFGIFVTVVSLYRLTMINRFTLSQNPTADGLEVGTWSGLEIYVGIICACLPNFNSLLKPVYAWMGCRTQSPHTGGTTSRSGAGSAFHGRSRKDEQSVLGSTIRATTVIQIEEHGSHGHSLSNGSSDGLIGQDCAVASAQDIELGMVTTANTTCERAWT